MRKLFICLPLIAVSMILTGCFGSAVKHLSLARDAVGYLPSSDSYKGLVRIGTVKGYMGLGEMQKYLGPRAKLFYQYGATSLNTADYYLEKESRTLTIESYQMESLNAAAGFFHYYRGRKLKTRGQPVDVGAEGVVDKGHGGRNLYFYKKLRFFKIVYTGSKPVPDLTPLGKYIADLVPGASTKPRGFEYLDVEGVKAETGHVSPGYTFNCDFLPPGIFAEAPGAGPIAELFIISHTDNDGADRTARDYRTYLDLNGKDFTVKHKRNRSNIWWARDPDQGRIVCTQYRSFVIGVVRPQTYEDGEAMLDKVVDKMRSKHYKIKNEKK